MKHTGSFGLSHLLLGLLPAALALLCVAQRQQATRRQAAQQQRTLVREREQLRQSARERTDALERLATHLQQVREAERDQLARELHDELGALLTAAKLDVARLKSHLGPRHPEAVQRLQHLADMLNHGIALKRRIIEELRPSTLSNLGLAASLEILAQQFSEQSGVAVELSVEAVELDEDRQLTVYRVVQESLSNVARHGQAARACIALHAVADAVHVEVHDDGRGFDPAQAQRATHGLAGMHHRVHAAGGRLQVDTAPGRGTRVRALLPRMAPRAG